MGDLPTTPGSQTVVRPFYRVVANGVEGGKLKATLIITPEPVMPGAAGIALEHWPEQMAAILARATTANRDPTLSPDITLQIFAGTQKTDPEPVKGLTIVGHGASPHSDWAHVNRLWEKSIVDAAAQQLKDPWGALSADIERSLTGRKHDAFLQAKYPKNLNTTPAKESFDENGAIIARRPSPSDKITVSGVVANKQSELAIDEERVRAQRVLRKMIAGPGLPGDADELPFQNKEAQPDAGKKYESGDKKEKFQAAVRERLFDNLRKNIVCTDENRKDSLAHFDEVKNILETNPDKTSAKTHKSQLQSPIASAARVTDGVGGQIQRAGHVYGGWLQSVQKGKDVTDTREYEAEEGGSLSAAEATALERVRGVYYSFQGDFFLSRLFCLSVDVTCSIPKAMAEADKPVYVYLAAEGCSEKRKTTQTLTAACFDKKTQFWPVSRFDLPGTSADIRRFVEQRAGVWLLGNGYGSVDPGPRYHLSSVDFRRSVDATEDAVDRGQRHNTAGITILDRGRGEQIARDLAISNVQATAVCDQAQHKCNSENRNCVVLWAEELTIGRRLNVAVVKERADVGTTTWRSLMQRKIAFKVEPSVKEVLKRLVGARYGGDYFHDETSFQLVTRSMPLLDEASGEGPRRVEAIADEALVTWDGTPLAALARQDSDEDKAHKGPRLPFTRTHGLEIDGRHRPPPLRYGVGYAFSMRSVFVGGGSPSIEDATAFYRASGGTAALPPAIPGTKIQTRKRFLRHESIDAPPVLLPWHLAEKKYGAIEVMGFEISDRVVLRSEIKPGRSVDDLPERYVNVKDRATPDKSMRIFVAPTVPLDTAIRHRKLDQNGLDVMRGGLRHVWYDPAMDGFPIVVTERAPEFNGDLANVSRSIVQNKTSAPAKEKQNGATVFMTGENSTPFGKVGYLPDPAAEKMVVRLRVRGSDRYLVGAWVTPLYDKARKINYPHALPLVVTIEKLAAARAVPARACKEVLNGDPRGISKISKDGTFGTGADVRHLTVRLAPGEDYDLEVVCLPDSETLAHTFSLPETIALQLDYSGSDACGADDLVCLCGPGSQKRLIDLRDLLIVAEDRQLATEVGVGGWAAPGMVAVEAIAKQLIATIQSNWQIEELAAVQRVQVCHAINAPVTPPVLMPTGVKRPMVKKSDTAYAVVGAPSQQGAVAALLQGKIALDLEQIGAFELVVKASATGGKLYDDKARSRSLLARRSGRWPQVVGKGGDSHFVSTRDVLGFEVAEDGRVTFPTESVKILRVDNLPDPRAMPKDVDGLSLVRTKGRLTEMDLAFLHAAGIVKQSIDIPVASDAPCPNPSKCRIIVGTPISLDDTRARRISITAVAISRFSPLFETASFYNGSENLLKRRQPLAPGHQSLSSEEKHVWIPSTVRPARCDARPPAPNFVFERSASKLPEGSRQCVSRTARTRLHFGRGMFDSGEGERIGIVLWPPDYREQNAAQMEKDHVVLRGRKINLHDLDDDDLGPGGRFVTRWGGDPIRKDIAPQQGNLIPASTFRDFEHLDAGPHQPRYVPRARMPIDISEEIDPATGKVIVSHAEPPEFLEVSLLTYEPCFDLDREEWYVDVDLRSARATDPFVRFGLVRYQEHSIDPDLMLSEPVSVWAQVLPHRTVELTQRNEKGGGMKITAVVSGQASAGIQPVSGLARPTTPAEKKTLDLLDRSFMQMTIVHEGLNANNVLTRTPIWTEAAPIEAKAEPAEGLMRWLLEPPSITPARILQLGKGALVAYIEEVERRMPATYSNEPISVDTMLAEKTIVSSGPRFSARVVFHETPAKNP